MGKVSYTQLFSSLFASGLFVATLTNSGAVFSQSGESSSLSALFKKIDQYELLAAVEQPSASGDQVVALTKAQIQAKFKALEDSGKTGEALLQSFLNTSEGKAQQELFLEVAKEEMPGQDALIGQVASSSGYDSVLVLAQTGFETAAGENSQQQQQADFSSQSGNAGAGGGGAPVSGTSTS